MRLRQARWTPGDGWNGPLGPPSADPSGDAVLVFGARSALEDGRCLEDLRTALPGARLFGCSTAGEICGTQVTDDAVVATHVAFAATRLESACIDVASKSDSFAVGAEIASRLAGPGLVHVLVLSDGLQVNGSDLVRGIVGGLPPAVPVTGGLAGDGGRFERTLVLGDGGPRSGVVAAIGLYGDRIRVGYGSLGGWDTFGPERVVTRSEGNVLFELDGHSALELYKRYLGEHAAGLPATGLLFPLSVRRSGGDPVVRTILGVDEKARSMTFAGDVPEGAFARLMKANFERLIDGAVGAARTSQAALGSGAAELAVLISCVGRKMVLRQRVEEEVEGVRDVVGPGALMTGFYSYGEISPFTPNARCELHNQTMTITTLTEA